MLFLEAPSNTPGAPSLDANALAAAINAELTHFIGDLEASLFALCQVIPVTPPASGLWLDQGVLSLVVGAETGTGGLINDGGVLQLTDPTGWPTSPAGLLPGAVWNNHLAVAIVPGATPDPLAAPVLFGAISSAQLLALGGGNLPLADPHVLNQIWNNGGEGAVSDGVMPPDGGIWGGFIWGDGTVWG